VTRDILESIWSVFLNPAVTVSHSFLVRFLAEVGILYHGRLSSASTGRFAALLLPFAFVLSELNIIESLAGGASTSISSSKSDMLG